MFTKLRKQAKHALGALVSPRQRVGAAAEQRALEHLRARGLRLVERNYRAAYAGRALGEIDLIMRDGGTLVFVEVRQRAGASHGGAAASVTPTKRARLIRAAQHYLQSLPPARSAPECRFDVVAVDGDGLQWLQAAFDADGD